VGNPIHTTYLFLPSPLSFAAGPPAAAMRYKVGPQTSSGAASRLPRNSVPTLNQTRLHKRGKHLSDPETETHPAYSASN